MPKEVHLEQALDRCPYNTEVVYNLAVNTNDIGKTQDLIGQNPTVYLRRICFSSYGYNADLSKTKRSHSRVDDKSKSNIVEWSLLVSHKILCNAYTQMESIEQPSIFYRKSSLTEAFKRSPYTNEVSSHLNLRMQHDN